MAMSGPQSSLVALAVTALPDDARVDADQSSLSISKMTLPRMRTEGVVPPFVVMPAGTQYRKDDVGAWVLANKSGMPSKKP